MSIKIKYASDGRKEAEVELDQAFIQNQDSRDGYMAMHDFLTSVVGDNKPERRSRRDHQPEHEQADSNRTHNKSLPHFKADRRLAKFIIDNGGLKHLHGVNYINRQQVFFFDRAPMVQAMIELYNEQDDRQSETVKTDMSERKPKRKRSKKRKHMTAGADSVPAETHINETCTSLENDHAAEHPGCVYAEGAGLVSVELKADDTESEVTAVDE